MDESWKYCIEERVRWGDVDAARIIFYGAYIRFFEFAETELFRAVGFPYSVIFDQLDVWLPRAHIECDFLKAAQLDENATAELDVSALSAGEYFLKISYDAGTEVKKFIVSK